MARHRPPRPPRPNALPLPEAHILLTSFNTFLIVAIHNILYYRAIYPQGTFLTAKAFNLPVHQSRHPRLCAWIKDAVDAVATQLTRGGVERVAVTIHAPATGIEVPSGRSKAGDGSQPGSVKFDASLSSTHATPATTSPSSLTQIPPNAVLERWIFDVSHYPAWPGGAAAMRDYGSKQKPGSDEARRSGQGKGKAREELNWVDVDESFRGVIRRMVGAAEGMDALPEGCAFTVAIELKEEGRAPIGDPQPWIPSEPNLQPSSEAEPEAGEDVGGANITPIRAAKAGPLYFDTWVEEGHLKQLLRPGSQETASQMS